MTPLKAKASQKHVTKTESNFKRATGVVANLAIYPLPQHAGVTETNKSKSKQFGEVFTPLGMVDEMLSQTRILPNTTTLDLCAGFGQFSIRLLRYILEQGVVPTRGYCLTQHSFCEVQLSSCYKLLSTFGHKINLFIGDAKELPSLPGVASGTWVYIEAYKGWIPLTKTIKGLLYQGQGMDHGVVSTEEDFATILKNIIKTLNEIFTHMHAHRWTNLCRINEVINNNNEGTFFYTVPTPSAVVEQMLAQVNISDQERILILYNSEIIEGLSRDNHVGEITFGNTEVNSIRSKFLENYYGVSTCTFTDNDPKTIREALGTKKWDLVLSNPPYNGGMDLDIIKSLIEANSAKEYVLVHPSTWVFDRKGKSSKFNDFKKVVNGKLRSVKFFNGNSAFEKIQLNVPCMITHIDTRNPVHSTKVTMLDGETFTVSNIEDITKYGSSWGTIVKSFFDKIPTTDNVWDHRLKSDNTGNLSTCQISRNMGHAGNGGVRFVNDDFYTLVVRDSPKVNHGIRKALSDRGGPAFGFKTSRERDNFLSYLCTDFARFCLSLLKNKLDVDCGEMTVIPWLDFTQTWDDEKLFAHFGINQETQDYIRSFLPDYYGIRKPKTE